MEFESYQLIELIEVTECLMLEYGISIRDTWKGFYGCNLDDFYSNGNSYGGKKLIKITVKENGFTDMHANKIYMIEGFKSAAYDNYEIRVPKRLGALKHPIIHELVHFLQVNTVEEDKQYISFGGQNTLQYMQYLNQRTEQEAHYIQLLYIEKYELKKVVDDEKIRSEFRSKLYQKNNPRFDLLMYAKQHKII
ncbi:MAG: hypothetical protein RLZZ628_966 [Bacteroidota bacterium]|jgi:hypothetical protein